MDSLSEEFEKMEVEWVWVECLFGDVHDDSLRNVIRVVPRHYLVHPQLHRAPVQGLAPELAAERVVVLEPDLGHDLVYSPAVQVFIWEDLEGDIVLVSVLLDSFQAVM